MKRKAIALALAMSMLATMTPLSGFAASVTDFKDVPASSWYYDSVKDAVDDGFMNGVSSDIFKPAGNLTRAMFVTMLARFDKAAVDNNAATSFTDVKTGEWYSGSVAWAVKNGIVTGYSASKFGTEDHIKREDAAVMVYRYAQMKGLKLKEKNTPEFKDEAQITAHAKEAMDYCRKYGVFVGDQNDMVYPQKLITRAEAAAVIERLKNIVEESQTPTPVTPDKGGSSSGGDGGGGHSSVTKYDITWVVDENGTTKSTTPAKGDKLVPPVADSEIVREGYEFVGWSTKKDDVPENAIKTADLPNASESTTYYPVWKKIETPVEEYTITWDANGGSWDKETTKKDKVTKGVTPTLPADPVREGYTFIGWNTSPSASEAGTVAPVVKSDTYFAVWVKTEADEFVINWNLNYEGAPALSPTTVKKGEKPAAPEVSRSGYDLKGWNQNPEAATGDIVPATEGTTYYAIWTEKEPVVYEITWDANGGSWTDGNVKKTSVKENTVPEKPADPVREGYTFIGWNIDDKATDAQNPSAATAAVTYYAVWEAIGYNYVLDITAIVKNLTPFEIIPVDEKDESAVDDQLTKYKVVYDEQGNIAQDKSDDIKLSSVASDLCNKDNIESILNALKGKSFVYNGTAQTPIGEDGRINDLIVGYMPVADNLPEDTADQIADIIKNDETLPEEIRNNVDATSVTTLLKKLDDGVTTEDVNEVLTPEEKVIAEKVSAKLDEYTGDKQGELLDKIKDNESASNIITQLGLSDDDIIGMVADYKDKLDAILAAMNTAETASLLDDTQVTTKGGIPVVVNPVKAAKEQYSKGFEWYVQNLSKRLVNAGYVSQGRVNQLNLAKSDAVKELYDSSNPDNWVSGDDKDGYFINSAETLASELKGVVASLEKARQEYIVDKDAARVAEIIKNKYELAKTKPGSSMLPQLTDETINKLAEIAVMKAPTLDDLEKAGFTEKEYSIARDLAADDALSLINRVFDRINYSAAEYVSDGVKQSIAEKAAGHYELHVKITKEEYTESAIN